MLKGEGYKIRDQSKPHILTLTVVAWIDVFTRKRYRDIILESMAYYQKEKGMVVYGYVIMGNHIHMIVQSKKDDVSGLLRDFKKYTSKPLLLSIQNEPESRRERI